MAHAPKTRSEKAVLSARRAWCYLVLVLISFLCLFFFYILIVNSTRTHFEIQKGFSLLPGKSMLTNFKNVLADANIPVGSGIRNSLIVSACSAALSVYFSALTAYGIYAYNFKFKKAAFAIILLIMTMPTQVSALGFLQLITKMGLKNSFIPLIVPSIAAPTVFFFMKQYLDPSLPMEIVEAARIDGANRWQTLWRVTIPNVMPSITICMFLSLTNGFKLFDQNLALTAGRPFQQLGNGETIKTTEMLALNIVNAFGTSGGGNRGVGQAKAVIFFIVVAAISIIQLQANRRKEVQQ